MSRLRSTRRRGASALVLLLAAAWSGSSCSIVDQGLPNEAPVVQVREADTTRVRRGGKVDLQVTASDADDDPLTYLWSALGEGRFTDSTSSHTQWIAPAQIAGASEVYLVQVTVQDHQPETEDPVESFVIEVVQRPPVLVAPRDTVVSFREPEVRLDVSARDEDGDPLSFRWELLAGDRLVLATPRPAQAGVSRAVLVPLVPGPARLAVEVTDGADTVRTEIALDIVAPNLPEGGTVHLDLPASALTPHGYEIDVYEYPNRRGEAPLTVDSWFEAHALCQSRGMRLCTAAEWANACRGPEGGTFSSTDDPGLLPEAFGLRFCNQTGSDLAGDDPAVDVLAPAGSFPNCASSAGVYDMTGNAFEWLADFHLPQPVVIDSVGVVGRFSLSSTSFTGLTCGDIASREATIPLEGDLQLPVPQAFIDSVLSAPYSPARIEAIRAQTARYQGYFTSGRGLRCCR